MGMTRTFRIAARTALCALALSLTAGGANEPRLLLPTSSDGMDCIAACDAERSRCISDESSRAMSAASGCDNSAQVQTCVDRAVDDRTELACQAKQNLAHCPEGTPNLALCNEARLLCALRCGAKMLDP